MGMKCDALLASQGDVGEGLNMQQLVEGGQQVIAVVVPAETVLRTAPHRAVPSLSQLHLVVRESWWVGIESLFSKKPTIPVLPRDQVRGIRRAGIVSMHQDHHSIALHYVGYRRQ